MSGVKVFAQSHLPSAHKTVVVGLDGSDLSFLAIQAAVYMMDDLKDNMLVVYFGKSDKDEEMFARLKPKVESAFADCHLLPNRRAVEFIRLKPDWEIAQALTYLANHHANGSAMLAIGAAGKGYEDRRTSAQTLPLGGLAKACLEHSKVPVLVIKNRAKDEMTRLNAPMKQSLGPVCSGTRRDRIGASGQPGLNWMVTIDGSTNGWNALDWAAKCISKKDKLHAFHVRTGTKPNKALEDRMSAECSKIETSGTAKEVNIVIAQPNGKQLMNRIIEYAEEVKVDFILMGSAELSKPLKHVRKRPTTYTFRPYAHDPHDPSRRRMCLAPSPLPSQKRQPPTAASSSRLPPHACRPPSEDCDLM